MKTKILWKNWLLESSDQPPLKIQQALTKHFSLPWDVLETQGLAIHPRPVGENSRPKSPAEIIADCTEPDGTVWGVRFFDVYPPGFLISPTSKWVWESETQIVPIFSNAEAVRGHHGFHAAWVADLQAWVEAEVDHHTTKCKALVRGHGDIVIGEVGWRSSRMTVVQVFLSERDEGLAKRYPKIVQTIGTLKLPEALSFDFPRSTAKLTHWIRERGIRELVVDFEV